MGDVGIDTAKLKLGTFKDIEYLNFPDKAINRQTEEGKTRDALIYYIDTIDDVGRFVDYAASSPLAEDNRVIMVYAKGRKDGVNRDSIFAPFKE